MTDTYETAIEAALDKARLRALLTALNGKNGALCLDDCRAWQIEGLRGTIHTWGDGNDFMLYVQCHSVRAWTYAKKSLAFCRVTQDGEDEGCFRLDHLPTPDEATAIREAIGLRQTRPPGQAENLRPFRFEPVTRAPISPASALEPTEGQDGLPNPDEAA